jgi:hypothetical protein
MTLTPEHQRRCPVSLQDRGAEGRPQHELRRLGALPAGRPLTQRP